MKTRSVQVFIGLGALLYGGVILNEAYRGAHAGLMLPVVCIFLAALVWFFQRARQLSAAANEALQKSVGSFITYAFLLILIAFLLGVAVAGGLPIGRPRIVAESRQ